MKKYLTLVLLSSLLSQHSHAAFGISIETDSSGDFVEYLHDGDSYGTASWSGNGLVQSNVRGSSAGGLDQLLVNDFSGSGTLEAGALSVHHKSFGAPFLTGASNGFQSGTSGPLLDGGIQHSAVTWSMTAAVIGGGSADLGLGQIKGNVSFGETRFTNLLLNDLKGNISSIELQVDFSEAMASAAAGPSDFGPLLGGFRTLTEATGLTASFEYINPILISADGLSATAGTGSGSFIDMSTSSSTWGAGSSYTYNPTNTTGWQGVNSLDIDNDGSVMVLNPGTNHTPIVDNNQNGTVDELERFYATGLKITLTHSSGNLTNAGADGFAFSFDGSQWESTLAATSVPEPSAFMSLFTGLSLLLLRRKK